MTFIRRLLGNVLEGASSWVCRLKKPSLQTGLKLFSADVNVLEMRWQFVPGGRCRDTKTLPLQGHMHTKTWLLLEFDISLPRLCTISKLAKQVRTALMNQLIPVTPMHRWGTYSDRCLRCDGCPSTYVGRGAPAMTTVTGLSIPECCPSMIYAVFLGDDSMSVE